MMASGLLRRIMSTSNERGSILLITLVSVAIVALLGLAVYDLALIEAQFSAASVIDYRAYEIAQAGIERGIREFRDLYIAYPPGSETFVQSSTTCAPTPCNTTQFHPANLTNTTVPAQTIAAGPFAGGVDPGGVYLLELKYLTVDEARNSIDVVSSTYPYGLQCFPDKVHGTWCANLAFLKSTGTATDGAGNTRTRTIQTLVRATSTSPWAGGIVAGNGSPAGSPAVSGEVLIAGGIQVLGGSVSNPAVGIGGGSNAGVMNSWYALDSSSPYSQSESTNETLSRLKTRQLICPPATNCTGGTNLVESLGAEIKIYGNINGQMVNVGAGTPIGLAGVSAPYQEPQRLGNRGKGALDGIYIAGGCELPCIGIAPQPFNSGASISVDRGNLTKPYPSRPPIGPLSTPNGTWPTINDLATIYNYSTLTPANLAYFDWFKKHTDAVSGCTGGCTASIIASAPVNAANCLVSPVINCNHGLPIGNFLNPIADGPSSYRFRHSFTFKDRGDNLRLAEICWMRDMAGSDSGSAPPSRTLEFGMPTCETPNSPANPVLLWIQFPWGINRSSGNPYNFRGAAVIVTSGGFYIDESFQSYCPAAPCSNNKFPEDHLFAIMTDSGNIDLAFSSSSIVSRIIMGYFFASGGNIRVWRDVNIAGMLRADSICFRNSSGCSGGVPPGGKGPGFFQASFLDARQIPNELPASYELPTKPSGGRWQVTSVPQFWIECRRGPSGTLPATPSGICPYDQ
jgi:hypothetical protein